MLLNESAQLFLKATDLKSLQVNIKMVGNIKIPNAFFGENLQVENEKIEQHHWFLHIQIILGAKVSS